MTFSVRTERWVFKKVLTKWTYNLKYYSNCYWWLIRFTKRNIISREFLLNDSILCCFFLPSISVLSHFHSTDVWLLIHGCICIFFQCKKGTLQLKEFFQAHMSKHLLNIWRKNKISRNKQRKRNKIQL